MLCNMCCVPDAAEIPSNYLSYESQVSEVLTTGDGSDLNVDCTRSYTDEAAKKTTSMMAEISDALIESECSDIVTSVTSMFYLSSMGNQVRFHVEQNYCVLSSSTLSEDVGYWPFISLWLVGLCCLMTPGLSKDIRCHV